MDYLPLNVIGKCVASDDELFANMGAAIARGLPEISDKAPAHDGVIAICGSGPSIAGQLDIIRKMQKAGTPLVAVKDCHDWLLENGVVPDYAFAIDPQVHRWNCFKRKNHTTQYMIASQCNPSMFEHLEGYKVTIWHPYITKGQTHPKNKMVIGGATTSGLRAIALFYVMGWRHFALFGLDSSLDDKKLRVNGDGVKEGDSINEVRIDPEGQTFYCNPAMALQAQHFQNYYDWLPDAQFYPYGHGLLQAMIRKREQNLLELTSLHVHRGDTNARVSFIHSGGVDSASYRYRAAIPAAEIGASLKDLTADTLIFGKPQPQELMQIARAKARGAWVVVDFCDDHFDWMHYADALRMADVVTCPTAAMAAIIKGLGREAIVVPDPYEYPMVLPHCTGINLLWFGNSVNFESIRRVGPTLEDYPLRVVSNVKGTVPWSKETMLREFLAADIVILPATDAYKSNNRALESIRQGCYVVAEPHPSLMDIPGIWIGDIKEGIEWTRHNLSEANQRVSTAQKYVMENYSPKTVSLAWKIAMQRPTTSDAAAKSGTDG